jgi:CheY-like chemotaxis protein
MSGSAMRVLIVDEYPDVCETTADLLRRHGHECRTAMTTEDALAIAEQFAPEHVFVDIAPHEQNWYQLLEALLSRPAQHQPYTVALTSWPEASRMAMEAGFDQCLLKPATLDHLVAAADRARVKLCEH